MSRWYQRQWWYIERPFPWPLAVALVVIVLVGLFALGAALA